VLPESSDPVRALPWVALLAAFAGLARVLYGPAALSKRYLCAAVMVAVSTSWVVYSLVASSMDNVSAYLTIAIGVSAGLFTDDFLRRAREHWQQYSGPRKNEVDNDAQ
jgi:hypothetical protein